MTRIVVLGGGFAGLEAMRLLERHLRRRHDVELLLVSDRNYLLFTPLLPQVASSLVEPRHIVQPIRDIRGARRFRFRRDRVVDIDLGGRRVRLAEGEVTYDHLVIAVGGATPTFGIPGVDEHADQEAEPARRRLMLTVCVVGGGYTGVELVAELQDFFHSYVVPRYRGIEPGDYRLVLLEAGDEILRGVHPTLARRARRRLDREGIEVRTGTRVSRVLPGGVELQAGASLGAGLVIWAAGVKGHPTLASLPIPRDRLGRIIVNDFLEVAGHPGVYGAGDAVTIEGKPEASLPIIPAALAHGRLAAENIVAALEGRPPRRIDFAPRGMLVSLGERDAVVEVMGVRVSGYLAWLLWNALHLYKLVGVRKQLQVALDWSLAQFFPRDSSMMREVSRCPRCVHGVVPEERHVA